MEAAGLTILIIGGYGTFGGRLAQLLADERRLTLYIAGRSLAKAQSFCGNVTASATLIPHFFDRDADLETQLALIAPDIVVDATGPFQDYGTDPYRVVKACIAHGVHYLDLADGSAFVKNIAAFHQEAKARGLFVLSGVSSFPVLTAAVVRRLSVGVAHIRSVTSGIAPSPYAGVGLNVIRAIASYAGQKVVLTRKGRQSHGYALTETMRYTISPPGMLPLHNLHFSLVDVPDLQIIPGLVPGLESIWIGAGPVPEILHRMLNRLAWLVRLKLIRSLSPFADIFYRAINILRWGEHRGGMFVSIEGTRADGSKTTRSWHLLAEGNDGPMIPSMAIEAIIRHMLEGRLPAPGARSAASDLELSDFESLFARRTIYTGFRGMHDLPADTPLYRILLEDAWKQLPPTLQALHNLSTTISVSGMARVERSTNKLAYHAGRLFGFPESGADIPVSVNFTRRNGKEHWQRSFAGKKFSSVQWQGKGRMQGLLCERFGPFTVGLALVIKDSRLELHVRRWSFLGLRLPFFLAPCGNSYEFEQDGRFHFHVEITHPLVGLIVRYQGWLE